MDWFTADLHLKHWNINKHCNRNFSSLEEMDKTLIDNINMKVKKNDRLYIVGDFAWWRCSTKQLHECRSNINCNNIYLIVGNHDEPILDELRPLFTKTEHILEIKVQTPENPKQRIIMCHYAMRVFNQSHRKSFHLYGHSHHNLPDDPKSLSFDVGVDGKDYNFSPINLEKVCTIMSNKQCVEPFEKEDTLYRKNNVHECE